MNHEPIKIEDLAAAFDRGEVVEGEHKALGYQEVILSKRGKLLWRHNRWAVEHFINRQFRLVTERGGHEPPLTREGG